MLSLHQIPKPKPKELRLFGVLLTVFLTFFSWKAFRFHGGGGAGLLGAAGVSFLLALAWPVALFWVHRVMMYAVFPIGWVISRVVLLVVLVLIMAPLRLLLGLMGQDKMARRWQKSQPSYWEDAEHPNATAEDYARLF